MLEKLYGKYFQKSRSFLYPILGIRRTSAFAPTGTYISLDGLIEPDEMKLIVVFKEDKSEEFKAFEQEMLVGNPLHDQTLFIKEHNIYVFNFESYKNDWNSFLLGNYSYLSTGSKRAIKTFYGQQSAEWEYMETYLFPEKHYDTYASLLGVDLSVVKTAGQLCDPCDLDKETLKIPVEDLENLKKVL